MARGVPGQVQRTHPHATAEIPHGAVGVGQGVGPRGVVEVDIDLLATEGERELCLMVNGLSWHPRECLRNRLMYFRFEVRFCR